MGEKFKTEGKFKYLESGKGQANYHTSRLDG